MSVVTLAVQFPYTEFDFGNGLPVIDRRGTVVTDGEATDVMAAAALLSVPVIRLIPVSEPDPFPLPPIPGFTPQGLAHYVQQEIAGFQAVLDTLEDGGQVFEQLTPAGSWHFTHLLARLPSVTLFLLDGTQVYTDVVATATDVYLEFPAPTAGRVVLT